MRKWIPFIMIAAMLGISSLAVADETEAEFEAYIYEDDSAEMLVAADDEEALFEEDGLIEDIEAAEDETQSIPIDERHFPDPNFRTYISDNFDIADSEGKKDGVLSAEEIAAVTEMSIPCNVESPVGFSNFTALETLAILDNTSLKRLSFGSNRSLRNLNISGCTNLTYLSCEFNQLTRINISKCPKLEFFTCYRNKLSNLDVSGCPALKTLNCQAQYKKLSSLNIKNCKLLETCLFNYTSYYRETNWDSDSGEYSFDYYMYSKGDTKYELYFDPTAKIITSRGTFPAYSTPASIKKALAPKATEKITITKKPTIKKPTATKNKITVKWKHFKHTSKKTKPIWKKIKKVQVQCATDSGFKNIVKTATVGRSKTKTTIKGLNKKTTYYVRVRYFDGTGYSNWSKTKKIKTKK